MNPPIVSHGSLTLRVPARRLTMERVIAFLAEQFEDFPTWADVQPGQNEDYYNQRLDRFLQVRAREHLDALQFAREFIHETVGRHDLGVFPARKEGLVVRGRAFSPAEPFYTIECKRLPVPAGRHREYLTSERHEKPRGGVQRYKLCIHGAGLDEAGIVGYVQKGDLESWRNTINGWVSELASAPVDQARWTRDDRLRPHRRFKRRQKTLVSRSESVRVDGKVVALSHFFIDLRPPAQPQFEFKSEASFNRSEEDSPARRPEE